MDKANEHEQIGEIEQKLGKQAQQEQKDRGKI